MRRALGAVEGAAAGAATGEHDTEERGQAPRESGGRAGGETHRGRARGGARGGPSPFRGGEAADERQVGETSRQETTQVRPGRAAWRNARQERGRGPKIA